MSGYASICPIPFLPQTPPAKASSDFCGFCLIEAGCSGLLKCAMTNRAVTCQPFESCVIPKLGGLHRFVAIEHAAFSAPDPPSPQSGASLVTSPEVALAATQPGDRAASSAAAPGWIAIARHGKPALSRAVQLNRHQYRDWWRMYDAGGLSPGQTPPAALHETAAQADVLLASTLPRAMETAAAVAGGKPVTQDALFIEAALPPPPIPGRFNPGAWGVFARIAWWFGLSGDEESRSAAEDRAREAALHLIARAQAGENILLLAHGWFNRMIRPHLLRRGWRCEWDGGDKYWSHRLYRFPRNP